MNYLTTTGKIVRLSNQPLGRGGEGQVTPVVRSSSVVAKIFHNPTLERQRKVSLLMADQLPQTNGHKPVAWPQDLLFSNESRPKFAGYLMPRIKKAQPSFMYYNPQLRRSKCPGFDYRYLVRSAHNLAAAVALAHSRGYIIGDLNESNIFIGLDTFVTLIDVDSWQIVDRSAGITYRAWGGKADFLAPEIQGIDLTGLDRQPWHDNFALGIAVFKLLNEGTHPFDALYHGKGDPPPIEERIKSGSFPYSNRCSQWTIKPLAPPIDALHPELKRLFVQTFELGHFRPRFRPDARTWRRALAQAEKDLRVCPAYSSHWCWANTCIWCERRQQLCGLDPFPGVGRAGRSNRQLAGGGASPARGKQTCTVASPPHPQKILEPLLAFARNLGQLAGFPLEAVLVILTSGIVAAGILTVIIILRLIFS